MFERSPRYHRSQSSALCVAQTMSPQEGRWSGWTAGGAAPGCLQSVLLGRTRLLAALGGCCFEGLHGNSVNLGLRDHFWQEQERAELVPRGAPVLRFLLELEGCFNGSLPCEELGSGSCTAHGAHVEGLWVTLWRDSECWGKARPSPPSPPCAAAAPACSATADG